MYKMSVKAWLFYVELMFAFVSHQEDLHQEDEDWKFLSECSKTECGLWMYHKRPNDTDDYGAYV